MKQVSILLMSALLILGTAAGAADNDPSDKNPKGAGAYGPGNPPGDVCECNVSQAGILPNNNSKQYNHLLNDNADAPASTPAPNEKGSGTH